jgi:hypothetical protein
MIYADIDHESGQIISLSNRNLFGDKAFVINLDAPLTEIIESWFVQNGILTARPHLETPDLLSFLDGEDILIPCPDGSRVLGFDLEFFSVGGMAVINTASNVDEFELIVIPPFPYRNKVVKVSLPRRISTA